MAVGGEGETLPEPGHVESGERLTVVLVAGAANLLVALTKAVAGVISNSSAMLSEAAHSVAAPPGGCVPARFPEIRYVFLDPTSLRWIVRYRI